MSGKKPPKPNPPPGGDGPWAWIVTGIIGAVAIAGGLVGLYEAGIERGKREMKKTMEDRRRNDEQAAEQGAGRHAQKVRSREEERSGDAGRGAVR